MARPSKTEHLHDDRSWATDSTVASCPAMDGGAIANAKDAGRLRYRQAP